MKRLLAILCLITCLFSLTACGNSDSDSSSRDNSNKPPFEYDKSKLQEIAKSVFEQIRGLSDEQLEQMRNPDTSDVLNISAANSWMQARDELGKFIEIKAEEAEVENGTDQVIVTLKTKFEKNDMNFDVTFKQQQVEGQVQPVITNVECKVQVASIGERLKRAWPNILMGLGVVFVVLLCIALLVLILKCILGLFNKAKEDVLEVQSTDASDTNGFVGLDMMNDLELVAVITAAIAASEQTGTDGFVVRSIKKSNKNKWQRA